MIAYRGDHSFAPSAAPEWNQQIFDLDTLTERYRGGRDGLDTFLNSLVRFQPSAIDPNMYLVNWGVTGGTAVFPEVSLVFNGKKNGVLPFGRRSTETKTQTASVQTPYGPITITYRVRTPIYEWISLAEGQGGSTLPDASVSSPTTTYILTGDGSVQTGTDILNIINSSNANEIRLEDRIEIVVHDPSIPITDLSHPTLLGAILAVKAILSQSTTSAKLRIQAIEPVGFSTYARSTETKPTMVGFHTSDLPVSIVNIRMGCGVTPITGASIDLMGPILVSSYFAAITTPDLQATEVVPDKYWKNRQELVTSLLPLPC